MVGHLEAGREEGGGCVDGGRLEGLAAEREVTGRDKGRRG